MSRFSLQTAALVNIGVGWLSFGWRVSLGLQLILACGIIIGSPLIPESPRYIRWTTNDNSILIVFGCQGETQNFRSSKRTYVDIVYNASYQEIGYYFNSVMLVPRLHVHNYRYMYNSKVCSYMYVSEPIT